MTSRLHFKNFHVDGAGTLSISYVGQGREGRPTYTYGIVDAAGNVLENGREFSLGAQCDHDIDLAAETLLTFLSHGAEQYRYAMGHRGDYGGDGPLFSAPVMEWAYQHDSEIMATWRFISESLGQGL